MAESFAGRDEVDADVGADVGTAPANHDRITETVVEVFDHDVGDEDGELLAELTGGGPMAAGPESEVGADGRSGGLDSAADGASGSEVPEGLREPLQSGDSGDPAELEMAYIMMRAVLELWKYPPESLSDAKSRAISADGKRWMRVYNKQLIDHGVSVEERARILSELRNWLRDWVLDHMSSRVVAAFLAATLGDLTPEDLVARTGRVGGPDYYEAVIAIATHGGYAPGKVSAVETTALYSQFELRMRDFDEQLIRDGASVEERARILYELRNWLRAWTRELMDNRVLAEFLAAKEANPRFEDLAAKFGAMGLVDDADAVYEAIIYRATHSHYALGSLSSAEVHSVYTTFEWWMRDIHERLVRHGFSLLERATIMFGLRAELSTWTRALMSDRGHAVWLEEKEPNPTLEEVVAELRDSGLSDNERSLRPSSRAPPAAATPAIRPRCRPCEVSTTGSLWGSCCMIW